LTWTELAFEALFRGVEALTWKAWSLLVEESAFNAGFGEFFISIFLRFGDLVDLLIGERDFLLILEPYFWILESYLWFYLFCSWWYLFWSFFLTSKVLLLLVVLKDFFYSFGVWLLCSLTLGSSSCDTRSIMIENTLSGSWYFLMRSWISMFILSFFFMIIEGLSLPSPMLMFTVARILWSIIYLLNFNEYYNQNDLLRIKNI